MNIKELKEKIKDLPDHMDVMMKQVNNDEFDLSIVENVEIKEVTFIGEKEEPKDKCLVISDEI